MPLVASTNNPRPYRYQFFSFYRVLSLYILFFNIIIKARYRK